MAILLHDRELEALQGLPMLAFRAYVAAIRPRMDLRTGFVGRIVRISYRALIEWCYVEPVPGVRHEPVTLDQMYRAVRVLERAGLVRIASEMPAKRLIFQCVLAETLSHAQKQAATRPRLEAATAKASNSNGFDDMDATHEMYQAATHRREEKKNNLSVSSSSSTEPQYVDAPQGGEEGPHLTAPQGGAGGPQASAAAVPLEVSPAFQLEPTSERQSSETGLVFPPGLETDQRRAIAAKISKLGNRRQAVLDELAGHMAGRAGNNPVRNPVRYVDFIIQKAVSPEWAPELAGAVRAAREKVSAQAAALAAARSARPANVAKELTEVGRAVIQTFLKPRKEAA